VDALDYVINMFKGVLGCVSICIAYPTDTFWHHVCHPRPYKVMQILVSAQVVAKKNNDANGISQD